MNFDPTVNSLLINANNETSVNIWWTKDDFTIIRFLNTIQHYRPVVVKFWLHRTYTKKNQIISGYFFKSLFYYFYLSSFSCRKVINFSITFLLYYLLINNNNYIYYYLIKSNCYNNSFCYYWIKCMKDF